MSQINSNIKDDFQVVLLLSCFVGHPVVEGSGESFIQWSKGSKFSNKISFHFIFLFNYKARDNTNKKSQFNM